MEAFKKVLAKFGIVELVRTGRISLKRGDRMFDMGGSGGGSWGSRYAVRPWPFSSAWPHPAARLTHAPHVLCLSPTPCASLPRLAPRPLPTCHRSASPRPHAEVEQPALHSADGDVYGAALSSVLDAAYDPRQAGQAGGPEGGGEQETATLAIEVQDVPGVLNQVGVVGVPGVWWWSGGDRPQHKTECSHPSLPPTLSSAPPAPCTPLLRRR